MAKLDVVIENRVRKAIEIISCYARVESVYVFGSHVDATADRWSDIDFAVFIEGLETWDLHKRARVAAQVQKEAGDDLEIHFFSTKTLRERDPAGFATWVLEHGTAVQKNV